MKWRLTYHKNNLVNKRTEIIAVPTRVSQCLLKMRGKSLRKSVQD